MPNGTVFLRGAGARGAGAGRRAGAVLRDSGSLPPSSFVLKSVHVSNPEQIPGSRPPLGAGRRGGAVLRRRGVAGVPPAGRPGRLTPISGAGLFGIQLRDVKIFNFSIFAKVENRSRTVKDL